MMLALPALRVTGPLSGDGHARLRHDRLRSLINEMDLPDQRPDGHQRCRSRCSTTCGTSCRQRAVLRHELCRGMKDFEYYFIVAAALPADQPRSWSTASSGQPLRPRVRGAAGRADRVRLHGRQRLQAQGHRLRRSAPRWRASAGALFAYSEQYIAPNNFSVRTVDPVPAGCDARWPQDPASAPLHRRAGDRHPAEPAEPTSGCSVSWPASLPPWPHIAGGAVSRAAGGRTSGGKYRRARGAVPWRSSSSRFAAQQDHRLQAVTIFGRDDPVRRLLPAGWHRRVRPQPPWPGCCRRAACIAHAVINARADDSQISSAAQPKVDSRPARCWIRAAGDHAVRRPSKALNTGRPGRACLAPSTA